MVEECDPTCLRIDFLIFSMRMIIITWGNTERIKLDILAMKYNVLQIVNTQFLVARRDRMIQFWFCSNFSNNMF